MNINSFFKRLSVSVFLLGVLTFAIGYGIQSANTKTVNSVENLRAGVKVTYNQMRVSHDGSEKVLQNKIERWQKADGSWKELITVFNREGAVIGSGTKYAVNGRGVFQVDEKNKQLHFLGARPETLPAFSENGYRKSSNFVGEGSVLGYKTLVERSSTSEFHSAPDLQGLRLKTIFFGSEDQPKTVIEAVNIELREPTSEEFGKLPDYPVVYKSHQKAAE